MPRTTVAAILRRALITRATFDVSTTVVDRVITATRDKIDVMAIENMTGLKNSLPAWAIELIDDRTAMDDNLLICEFETIDTR